jgi:hypothetical protein
VRPVDEPVRLSGSAVESSGRAAAVVPAQAHADTRAAPRPASAASCTLALDTALGAVWDSRFEPRGNRRGRAAARDAWPGSGLAARTRTLVTSERLPHLAARGRRRRHDREVVVRGSIDVLEVEVVEGQARVMVHDLKTGRALPSAAAVVDHAQLGVYQSAIAAGAADEVVRAALGLPDDDPLPVVAGGAALVQLRHDAPRGVGGPKVQVQPVPGPAARPATLATPTRRLRPRRLRPTDADAAAAGPAGGGPTWVEVLLGESARGVREEQFGPTPGPMCQFCEFAVVCPTVEAGQPVLR